MQLATLFSARACGRVRLHLVFRVHGFALRENRVRKTKEKSLKNLEADATRRRHKHDDAEN